MGYWPRVAAFAAALLLAASVHAPEFAMAAATDGDIGDAVETVLAAGDYQRTLPLPGGGGEAGGDWRSDPNWWRNEGDAQARDILRPGARRRDSDDGFRLDLPPAVLEVLRMLMWVVLFVGGALILYYLVNEALLFARRSKDDWRHEDEAGADVAGKRRKAAAALEDYDRLAAEGDYAGAVHALLLHCIAFFRERGAALSTSLTSREIVRRLQLEEREKEALSLLVQASELTHFGGRGATEADFRHCRDLFQRLVGGEAGGAA